MRAHWPSALCSSLLSIFYFCLLVAFSCPAASAASGTPPAPKPAKLKISGYGIFGDRQLKRMLRTLELAGRKPEFFGASFVEDAALILTSRIKRDGFLEPRLTIRLRLADGGRMQVDAASLLDNPLPRPLQITEAHFYVHKGTLYYYKTLEIEGLKSISEKQARSYFLGGETLLNLKRARIFTPERLQRGLSSLTEILDQQGYQQAKAEAVETNRNDNTGAVTVRVNVQEGPKFIVRSVHEEFFWEGATKAQETRTIFPNKPYSRLWIQDFTLSLKTNQFHRGYPDTSVTIKTVQSHRAEDRIEEDLLAQIKSGDQVHIGAVRFQGEKRTKKSLIGRRVRVHPGELLDPIRVEQGRFRLARLGIFDSVDLKYQPRDEHTRDVLYQLKEGKTLNVSLLFGWGSYELLRGGVDLEAFNLWGLAHHAEVRAIQSFKSSSGDLTYTVPEMVGRDIDLFVNGSGLRREEISFTRLEYGGGVGLHKYFQSTATDISTRYNYQILNALDFNAVQEVGTEGLTNPAVGSIITEIKHDRRDNPLYPRNGYKLFLNLETATGYLGGDANYQRLEFSPSWHHPLGGGRFLSLGLSHGVAISFGSPANNLPFNRRFFPGGATSIRGYQEGEASPRNEFGQFVGAETYTLGTIELEQALTPKWSVVLFSDSLGMARRMSDYPFDTGLFSVGIGLRWRTLIGPIRLEYGHNLNPRPEDPSGTVQFSLGFPF